MSKLRIAILHYHLRGGGVTRVIENTLLALDSHPAEICVITGEQPNTEELSIPEDRIVTVPGLSYGDDVPEKNAQKLLQKIKEKAHETLHSPPDVWHIHNHSLGKNRVFTQVASLLAESAQGLLLHLHDFAEDNRPGNYAYLSEKNDSLLNRLYPAAPHIHYGLLNGRDFQFLQNAGLPSDQLHLVSNPVNMDLLEDKDINENKTLENLILYPVRAIPRKNIGEFIFWSALESEHKFAITLAPKNPKYRKFYEGWKSFVEEEKLPVIFEASSSTDLSFPELLHQAKAIVTTSIAEGFGLIYLESWLAGNPLTGRLIDDITQDFKNKGVQFPGMYKALNIPVDWIGRDILSERLLRAFSESWKMYGKSPYSEKLHQWTEKILAEGIIDFGILENDLQKKVILKVLQQPDLKQKISPKTLFKKLPSDEKIQQNREIVESEFNISCYGKRLFTIYAEIAKSTHEKPSYIDSEKVLNEFLSPQNFSLLRT